MVASPPTSQNCKFKKKKTTLCAREVGTTYYIRKIYSASVVDLNIRRRFFGANLKKKGQFENLSDATATPGWWIARGSRNPSELASWIDGSTDLIRHQVCVYVGDEGSKDPGQTRGSNK
jgi:hypothetical protein